MTCVIDETYEGHDALAPSPSGQWERGAVLVVRDHTMVLGSIVARHDDEQIVLAHNLTDRDVSADLVGEVTRVIADVGGGRVEFETAMVGLVRSAIDDPVQAWATYYRNSLAELTDGSADFAPIHAYAARCAVGSVLDVGSSFGFFPLALAAADATRTVTATDVHAGTMTLLGAMAPQLGITLDTRVCDAATLPFPDGSVDTVTALHLLEHVDATTGYRIVAEAARVARRRVIVAVPYEDVPQACHGHIRSFDHDVLTRLGAGLGHPFTVTDHHGGWLVLDIV